MKIDFSTADEKGRFLHGDALQLLKHLPKKTFRLIVSSPPYNIGKSYERDVARTLPEYIKWQKEIIKQMARVLAKDGSICWQVGTFVKDGEVVPLDIPIYSAFKSHGLKLRNRIVWRYNFGYNADRRFSGRYETLLWFTKSDDYLFNLDPVRIPQIYPGKRHAKGKANEGKPSGNPLGKNPSDYWEFSAEREFLHDTVWNIPNVKNNHPEKTEHPCQFPVELVERCVLALTNKGDKILDPFVGAGTSVLAAAKHGRFGVGIDKDANFVELAKGRLELLTAGTLPIRQIGKPIQVPDPKSKVAKTPAIWGKVEAAGSSRPINFPESGRVNKRGKLPKRLPPRF